MKSPRRQEETESLPKTLLNVAKQMSVDDSVRHLNESCEPPWGTVG